MRFSETKKNFILFWQTTATQTKLKLALIFILYVIPIGLFAQIADEVREGETLRYDRAILQFIHLTFASETMNNIVKFMTDLGGPTIVTFMLVVASVYLIFKKHPRYASFLLTAVGGAVGINIILKTLFQRTRPELWERIVTEQSYSFPSGHAMASMALACAVIFLCWETKYRSLAIVFGVIYISIIAFTRLYLGVHYPTDILGGWLMSFGWVLIAYRLILKKRNT
jgi:undecaprenyl-diphosphatase